MNLKDEELARVIDSAIAESKTKVEALQKVIDFKVSNRSLVRFHITDFAFLQDKDNDAEEIANGILLMLKADAEGKYEDVTNVEL